MAADGNSMELIELVIPMITDDSVNISYIK